MKAAVLHQLGATPEYDDFPAPAADAGASVVRIAAAGVHHLVLAAAGPWSPPEAGTRPGDAGGPGGGGPGGGGPPALTGHVPRPRRSDCPKPTMRLKRPQGEDGQPDETRGERPRVKAPVTQKESA